MQRLFIIIVAFLGLGLALFLNAPSSAMVKGGDLMTEKPEGYPVAIFAGGCFWCIESEFRALDGVVFTRAGYMGGALDDPSYRDVTSGQSGHAEVVEVSFDPAKTDYEMLVEFFLTKGHDPTQLNRQGVDVGTQYRSAIFPVDGAQEDIARMVIERIDMNKIYPKAVVTTIEKMGTFWEGEEYHQQYYEKYEQENGAPHVRVLMKKGKKR